MTEKERKMAEEAGLLYPRYKSPIELFYDDIQMRLEDSIVKAVQNCGIKVDKDELIKALSYDRGQYDKGYADAMAKIVHCRNCVHATQYERTGDEFALLFCEKGVMHGKPMFFCGFGERREDATD